MSWSQFKTLPAENCLKIWFLDDADQVKLHKFFSLRDGIMLALVQARAPTLFLIFLVPLQFKVLHLQSNFYICAVLIINSV